MSDPHRIFNDLGRGCGSMNMLLSPSNNATINLQGKSLATVILDAAGQSANTFLLPAASANTVGTILIACGYDSAGGGDTIQLTDGVMTAIIEPGEVALIIGSQSGPSTYKWLTAAFKASST